MNALVTYADGCQENFVQLPGETAAEFEQFCRVWISVHPGAIITTEPL